MGGIIVSFSISFAGFDLKQRNKNIVSYLSFYITPGKVFWDLAVWGEREGELFITFAFSKWRCHRISETQAGSEFRKGTHCCLPVKFGF